MDMKQRSHSSYKGKLDYEHLQYSVERKYAKDSLCMNKAMVFEGDQK